jgi:MarR family transcriptional regulator, lower aerobic nicotinate degradation pathway regulator
MRTATEPAPRRKALASSYVLEEQIGFLLRCVSQRHATIFAKSMTDHLTPAQWTTMVKLYEIGSCSQNTLAQVTAIDAATIKGVLERLSNRGFIQTETDPDDGRRLIIALTDKGNRAVDRLVPKALEITQQTLEPLSSKEQELLLKLLSKIS